MRLKSLRFTTHSFAPASSLVEVLIVLAIISATLLNLLLLSTKAEQTIKRNELEDIANGKLLKALEVLKSPGEILIDDLAISQVNIDTSLTYFYSLDINLDGQSSLKSQLDTSIKPCDVGNPFYLKATEGDTFNFPLCLKINLVPIEQNGNRFYEATVYTSYEALGEQRSNILKTIRYGGFTLIQ